MRDMMYHHLKASYNVLFLLAFLFWLRQAGEHLSTEKHLQRYKRPPNVLVKIWICDPEEEESSEKHRFHHMVPVKNNLLPLLPSASKLNPSATAVGWQSILPFPFCLLMSFWGHLQQQTLKTERRQIALRMPAKNASDCVLR